MLTQWIHEGTSDLTALVGHLLTYRLTAVWQLLGLNVSPIIPQNSCVSPQSSSDIQYQETIATSC